MISTSSYIQSLKYINLILNYVEKNCPEIRIENSYYDGLNGEYPPLKIVFPNRYQGKLIILFPGASPYAEEHPKIIMLGTVLGKIGFKVYIPRIPPLKNLDISITNVQWILHFYQWLLNEEKINSTQISIVGLSYGGALMLKALLNPIFDQHPPQSILTYGTYFDAESMITFLTTGNTSINGKPFYIEPNEWGLVVIFQNYLKNLNLDWDTAGVQDIISLHIKDDVTERDRQLNKLNDKQQEIVQSVIGGKATIEVATICKAIIDNEKETFREMSPKYWCENIKRKIFLLHGSNDSMVPYSESVHLAEYLNESELLISHIFEHKEVVSGKGVVFKFREGLRLIHFFAKFFNHNEN